MRFQYSSNFTTYWHELEVGQNALNEQTSETLSKENQEISEEEIEPQSEPIQAPKKE